MKIILVVCLLLGAASAQAEEAGSIEETIEALKQQERAAWAQLVQAWGENALAEGEKVDAARARLAQIELALGKAYTTQMEEILRHTPPPPLPVRVLVGRPLPQMGVHRVLFTLAATCLAPLH